MKVLITGADGFIGKNLRVRLSTEPGMEVLAVARGTSAAELAGHVAQCDAVVHLAGENRPRDIADFEEVNVGFTDTLLGLLSARQQPVPFIFSSSTQATADNPYGRSKLAAEQLIERHTAATLSPAAICRLPGVFGKWCRPHYNSVVATFCHQVANAQAVTVNDPASAFTLVYVDDVVDEFVRMLRSAWQGLVQGQVGPQYRVTVGELSEQIQGFRKARTELMVDRVGTGLTRALYATYISHLPQEDHSYRLKQHVDPRGAFVEMLKTPDAGQFSYFTSAPGITRGRHYHHTKTEKFLVVQGEALFRFRHVLTGETYAIRTLGSEPTVVQTIPGWAHDITNEGTETLIALLWANEVFDRNRPDTFAAEV